MIYWIKENKTFTQVKQFFILCNDKEKTKSNVAIKRT